MKSIYILLIVLAFSFTSSANYVEFPNKVQLAEIMASLPFTEGCIMADYESVHVPSQDKTYYEALFWDSKTGQSKLYFYSYDTKAFKAYGDNVQLPTAPLESVNGKVMMDYTAVHVPSEDKTYYEALVWDTKSGKSKLYFYSYDTKAFKAYGENVQFPASPLDFEIKGDVMVNYTSVHVPSQDKTYYEALFWDTKTGQSALYFYSYDTKGFKKYGDNVQFPAAPLDEVKGDVMVDYTSVHVPSEDKTYYEALFWDTKTGKSKLYFYSYDSKTFKPYGENVQLPAVPIDLSYEGTVMADYASVHVPSKDKTYYEVLFWDTKTGKSALYFYSYDSKAFKKYEENVQFPATPLEGVEGEVMVNYTSVHVPSQDKTYYEALFWDSKTGKSKLYFYNYDSKSFKPYGENVQLTATPL
ncbi:MAG: hypothetical protein ACJA1C_002266 [Crocinitomicaceae bacterium]|jgi:hypothetical protein